MSETGWAYQDRVATAFDEVTVLERMGREGWELTGFGPFVLHFRRPEDPEARDRWEHLRLIELFGPSQRVRVERDGWEPAGRWGPFHDYKRPVARTA